MLKAGIVVGILFAATLAGCTDVSATSLDARDALVHSESLAQDFDLAILLGIAATEGPLEAALEAHVAEAMQSEAFERFDVSTDDGIVGDGLAASWISTHFVWDAERDLMGALVTEVGPAGAMNSVFMPFRGVYKGSPDLIERRSPDARNTLHHGLGSTEAPDPACAMTTTTANWNLRAVDAVAAAKSLPEFQRVMADTPDGEFTYFYLPEMVVDPVCAQNRTVQSNLWTIQYADLDRFDDAELATVVLDAASGDILDVSRVPLSSTRHAQLHFSETATDPEVPEPFVRHRIAVPVPVEAGTKRIAFEPSTTDPMGTTEGRIHIEDPLGGRHFLDGHWWEESEPLPGTWLVVHTYRSSVPSGQHTVEATVHEWR